VPERALPRRSLPGVRWLLGPDTEISPHAQAVGATVLRILLGLLWLYNVSWKRPPDFGQDARNGLYKFTAYAVSDPVLPPYSWVVDHLVLPVFTPFGWLVLVAETVLAVLLLTGTWVRFAAALGVAQSVAIGLSVAYAPHEWPWSYWLMIGAHLLLLVSASGRVLAGDAVRAGWAAPQNLLRAWGGLSVLVGLVSVLRSLGDPLAPRGPLLGSSDPSISLGSYNLLGGLVVLVAGVLLLLAARGGPPVVARAAAGLALVGGLSLHAQLGFSDPLLGGNATSAAYLFSVALVAVIASRSRPGVAST
jgi:hypothetical protein